MRKLKIFITVFILYEFVMLTVLQIPRFCTAVFNHNFCISGDFKYFLICIMLPVMIGLLMWWIPDISRTVCSRKCDVCQNSDTSIQDIFHEVASKQEIEKFISVIITIILHKFITKHQKNKEYLDDLLNKVINTQDKQKKQQKKVSK